jgi:hypothetical protein
MLLTSNSTASTQTPFLAAGRPRPPHTPDMDITLVKTHATTRHPYRLDTPHALDSDIDGRMVAKCPCPSSHRPIDDRPRVS